MEEVAPESLTRKLNRLAEEIVRMVGSDPAKAHSVTVTADGRVTAEYVTHALSACTEACKGKRKGHNVVKTVLRS